MTISQNLPRNPPYKLLVVSSFRLFNKTRFGGAKRLNFLVEYLSRRHDVDLVEFDGCDERGAKADQEPSSLANQYSLWDIRPSGITRFWDASSDVRYSLEQKGKAVKQVLQQKSYDATLLAYPWALSALDWLDPQKMGKICYSEDDWLPLRYASEIKSAPTLITKISKMIRQWQLKSHYQRHAKALSKIFCITPEEKTFVQQYIPNIPVEIIPYGIPLANFPVLANETGKKVAGFIGNFGHDPNLDAVNWLLNEIWPLIQSNNLGWELIIAGPGLPDHLVHRSESIVGVKYLGCVDNLEDFYRPLTVFINPIRIGGGLRTKLMECIAFGKPIITTNRGAQGLEMFQLEMAETAQEFSMGLLTLSDSNVGAARSQKNRIRLEDDFSIEKTASQLEGLLFG